MTLRSRLSRRALSYSLGALCLRHDARGRSWRGTNPRRRAASAACCGGSKSTQSDLSDSLRYAGFHHVCLQVDDVEATVAELRRRGVTIVTEPFVLPVIERRLAFFADPFGNLFELAEVLA
jgi:catechol 2,3-dioxygenase-like lactoylglutathione lyase family enzyme